MAAIFNLGRRIDAYLREEHPSYQTSSRSFGFFEEVAPTTTTTTTEQDE